MLHRGVVSTFRPLVEILKCLPDTVEYSFMSLWMKSESVTIQMKATEQYFPVVLFIMLYKVVLTFLSLWMKS